METAGENSNPTTLDEKPKTRDEAVRMACEGAQLSFADIAAFFPPKRGHKPCYGRGFVGRDSVRKLPIMCRCVARPWSLATGQWLSIHHAVEEKFAEDHKSVGQSRPSGIQPDGTTGKSADMGAPHNSD